MLTLHDDFSDQGYRTRILAKSEDKRDKFEQQFIQSYVEEEVEKARGKYSSSPELRRKVAERLLEDEYLSRPKAEPIANDDDDGGRLL